MVFGRRKATPIHEKDMWSYEVFAWRDALALAAFLADTFGAEKARLSFEAIPLEQVIEFEASNGSLIGDFIQKPEGQRPAFLSRISKSSNVSTQILFVVLAILGVIRAKAVMELRDRFRTELAPGRGNRITTAAVYDFSREMRGLYSYAWPGAVFDAIGLDYEDDEG